MYTAFSLPFLSHRTHKLVPRWPILSRATLSISMQVSLWHLDVVIFMHTGPCRRFIFGVFQGCHACFHHVGWTILHCHQQCTAAPTCPALAVSTILTGVRWNVSVLTYISLMAENCGSFENCMFICWAGHMSFWVLWVFSYILDIIPLFYVYLYVYLCIYT